MDWTVLIKAAVSALLLLPLNLIALGVIGYGLRKKWPRFGVTLAVGAMGLLIVLSTQSGALLLIRPLERFSAPLASTYKTGAQAIVVLGGGRLTNAPEYGGQGVPNAITLVRMRYAALLQKETGLPLLVTGGAPDGVPQSEAAHMARVLREDFSTPVKWLEEKSLNTAQNARFSAEILQKVGVQRILLVTDAIHMARAQRIFARNGFDVLPAPTQFLSRGDDSLMDFIPNASALSSANYAMHEWLGLCWYWLRY